MNRTLARPRPLAPPTTARERARSRRQFARWALVFLAVAEPVVCGWALALPLCALVVVVWGGR